MDAVLAFELNCPDVARPAQVLVRQSRKFTELVLKYRSEEVIRDIPEWRPQFPLFERQFKRLVSAPD